MKTDIQIAQEAKMEPIEKVAEKLQIPVQELAQLNKEAGLADFCRGAAFRL